MTVKKIYKIIFIGTPDFSVPTLTALCNDERFNVVAVITAPDAPVGRKQVMTSPSVKVAAQDNDVKILQPENIKTVGDDLKNLEADVYVTIAYGQILSKEILKIPKHGCLNLHASLLPKYRGASPIQSAIAQGESETGITLMKMDEGLDTGPIVAQEKISINKKETGESLHDKLAQLSAAVIIKYLEDYLAEKVTPIAQSNKNASLAPKLNRESGKIDWTKSAEEIERLVRAYYPWPGTRCMWGKKKLKIITASLPAAGEIGQSRLPAGTIAVHNHKLAVQCGQGALIIETLQPEGKKVTKSEEFLKGYDNIINTQLK